MHLAAQLGSDSDYSAGLCAQIKSTLEHHAIYISADEVVHKAIDDNGRDGTIVSETWISFLSRYPRWHHVQHPCSPEHAEQIVQRARARIGSCEPYRVLYQNCEHFVRECYSGSASSYQVQDGTTTALGATATGSAIGALGALPLATTSVPTFALGIIPWGTTTVVSAGVVGAGAAGGALVGATLALPIWFAKRRAQQTTQRRLPLGLINETAKELYVRAYKRDDTWMLAPVKGVGGDAEGKLAVHDLLELNPPEDSECFQVRICEYQNIDLAGLLSNDLLSDGAVVRRGSVYRVIENNGAVTLSHVSRGVLPAYN